MELGIDAVESGSINASGVSHRLGGRDKPAHGGNILPAGPPCGPGGGFRFENFADLKKFQQVLLFLVKQVFEAKRRTACTNEDPKPPPYFQKTLPGQHFHRLAHRGAANLKNIHQFIFRR
ncbi:hypothetical protein SAMN05660235_01073 [Sporolituus thermophilus DSM 23256]|uniref:Uncharacterized protein n=1 Tax=Sporolituus thermophilus DSM 23256 TaxID=1123285 RepID=A0A1G7JVJ6_9FIRM|nr:hypothetical protein SAMN05660235_01073 [Sporolituus thermophilus DSM 23256]